MKLRHAVTAHVACVAIAMCMPLPLLAQQDSIVPQIHTQGTAERSVIPDAATLTLSFWADGPTPADAGRSVAARADSIRAALVAIGIRRDSLATASQRYWWRGRIQPVVGPVRNVTVPPEGNRPSYTYQTRDTTYRAQDGIEVRTSDLSQLGAVVDSALAYGITDISNVRYEATDATAARAELLREATRRAREEAEIIAEANGETIGRTLLLTTQVPAAAPREYLGAIAVANAFSADARQAGTEIVPPLVQIRVTVYGRWELIRGR